MHGGHAPATFSVPGWLPEVQARIEDLSDLGADALRVELLLARLDEIRPVADGGSPK